MAFDSKAAMKLDAPLRMSASIESELCFQVGRFYCCMVLPHYAVGSFDYDYDRHLSFYSFFHAMTVI